MFYCNKFINSLTKGWEKLETTEYDAPNLRVSPNYKALFILLRKQQMSLTKYYDRICREPFLSAPEERELLLTYQNPDNPQYLRDQARIRILNSNLRFVFKTAKNYSRNDPTMFEDLISAGNEGLIVGLEKFNPKTGVRFLSYAGWWVKQRILEAMSDVRVVSLPVWKQQLSARIEKAKLNNENLTLDECKELFSTVSERYIEELFQTRYLTYHIDDMDSEMFLVNPIEEEVDERIHTAQLHAAILELPDMQQKVLSFIFGLENDNEVSMGEISKKLGVSKEQVKRFKTEGLASLHRKLKPLGFSQ